MGTAVSRIITGTHTLDSKIKKLQNKLIQQKRQTSNALEKISSQKAAIRNYKIQANKDHNDINYYIIKATKLHKYEDVIQDSDTLASHILSTDLNCPWMDNEKEKEYLKSVFDYVSVAISDPTFQLDQLQLYKQEKNEDKGSENK